MVTSVSLANQADPSSTNLQKAPNVAPSFPHLAKVESSQRQSVRQQKNKAKPSRKKLTKAKKVAPGTSANSAFKVLEMEQILRLPFAARGQYLDELGFAAIRMNQLQNKLNKVRYAVNNQESQKLYAYLFAEPAFAADDRFAGRMAGKSCIFAQHKSSYASNDAGSCKNPNRCEPTTKGSGVRCPFWTTGLTGTEACISLSATPEFRASAECEKVKNKKLEKLKMADYRESFEKAQEFYQSLLSNPEQDSEKLKAHMDTFKKTYLADLKNAAADPNVRALLLNVRETDRWVNPTPDNAWKDMESTAEETGKGIRSTMQDLIDYCNSPVDENTIRGYYSSTDGYDQERRNRLDSLHVAAVGDPNSYKITIEGKEKILKRRPTIREVHQVEECKLVAKANDEIRTKLADYTGERAPATRTPPPLPSEGTIVGSRTAKTIPEPPPEPSIPPTTGRPGGPILPTGQTDHPPSKDVADNTPASDTGATDAIPASNDIRYPTICKSVSEDTNHMLAQRSMRCMACAAEADVIYSNDLGAIRHKYNDRTPSDQQGISMKWLSLLSIAQKKCAGGKEMSLQDAMDYVQTIGHCSAKTYGFQQSDKKHWDLIKAWQQGNFNKGTEGGLFSSNEFKEVYGFDFSQIDYLFCHPQNNQFDKGTAKHRAQWQSSTYSNFGSWQRRGSPQLMNCVQEAKTVANTVYANTMNSTCMSLQSKTRDIISKGDYAGGTSNEKKRIMVAETSQGCMVSDAIIEHANGTSSISFSDPGDIGGSLIKVDQSNGNVAPPEGSIKISQHSTAYCPDVSTKKDWRIQTDKEMQRPPSEPFPGDAK